jgi:hypothetical protein
MSGSWPSGQPCEIAIATDEQVAQTGVGQQHQLGWLLLPSISGAKGSRKGEDGGLGRLAGAVKG